MRAHGRSKINENIATTVVFVVVLIPHQLFSSFGVMTTFKWKVTKDRRGVAGEIIPLALFSLWEKVRLFIL